MLHYTFKNDNGNAPSWTEKIYSARKDRICQILNHKKAKILFTCIESLLVCNSVTQCPLQENHHYQVNQAIALLHIRCCNEYLPFIHSIKNLLQMLDTLRDRCDSVSMKLDTPKACGSSQPLDHPQMKQSPHSLHNYLPSTKT
jgi:hypothetical protein